MNLQTQLSKDENRNKEVICMTASDLWDYHIQGSSNPPFLNSIAL